MPFALAAGLPGTIDSTNIIVTAGLAKIAVGSITMGLGAFSDEGEIDEKSCGPMD